MRTGKRPSSELRALEASLLCANPYDCAWRVLELERFGEALRCFKDPCVGLLVLYIRPPEYVMAMAMLLEPRLSQWKRIHQARAALDTTCPLTLGEMDSSALHRVGAADFPSLLLRNYKVELLLLHDKSYRRGPFQSTSLPCVFFHVSNFRVPGCPRAGLDSLRCETD